MTGRVGRSTALALMVTMLSACGTVSSRELAATPALGPQLSAARVALGCPVTGGLIAVRVLAPCVAARPMPQHTWIPMVAAAPKRAGWLSPAAKVPGQRLLYVSQFYFIDSCCPDAYIFIYPEAGTHQPPLGVIDVGGEPWGLYVDKHQDLYVANEVGTVTVYRRGSTSPSITYSEGLERPLYAIVDNGANVFVSQAARYYRDGGTVVEYRKGSLMPYRTLQTPGTEADGMAFDDQGNLYVAYRGYTGMGSIEEFKPGSKTGKVLGMTLNQPQGVIVDESGNILVVETGARASIGPHIDVFPPHRQTPSVEIPIPNTPNQLAIRRAEPRLFIVAQGGPVYGMSYPFLRKHPRMYIKEELAPPTVNGVALSNGQHF